MNCPFESREPEVLLDYAAGRTAPGSTAILEAHIASCAECRQFVSVQRSVWSALDGWDAAEISPDFNRRLYARIDEEERSNPLLRYLRALVVRWSAIEWPAALPVAVACAVLLLAVLVQSPARPGLSQLSESPVLVESIDVEQVERALDDAEMLRQIGAVTNPGSASSM